MTGKSNDIMGSHSNIPHPMRRQYPSIFPSPLMYLILIADTAFSIIADDSEAEQYTRTRLQSGGLLQADMAAFKAANPTCQLADFLRWHSPKDWNPDPAHPQGGSLSDRMAHQVCLETKCTGCVL